MTLKDTLTGLFKKAELPSLPDSFFFGVATADHQCEGYDPQYIDIRDRWEEIRCPNAARKKASDFWNRYSEDIELARKLGCTAFRFSIAWSRVEPEPHRFNQAAFDHYQDMIQKILSCDMRPVLTLHHFTWPVHVEACGGMIADNFPDIYADYVREVARHFAGEVQYWITFNEPNLLMGGYLKLWWDANYAAPPGLSEGTTTSEQVEAVGKLIRNLFLSHKKAYEIIKAENPNAQVGVDQYFYGLPLWLQKLVDMNASGIKGDKDLQKQADRIAFKRDLIRGNEISRFRAKVLEKDRIDAVMAALTRTAEREEQVVFSDAYFVTSQQLLIGFDSGMAEVLDLAGKEVAIVRGSTSEQILPHLLKDAKAKVFDDYRMALQSIDDGQASALLADDTILSGLMVLHPGKYRLIGERLTSGESYAAAIAKGDSGLLNVVDSVVNEFNGSPEAEQWRAQYMEITGQKIEEPKRTARSLVISESSIKAADARRRAILGTLPKVPVGTALRRIQDRGYIIVAVREDLPGFGYRDPETGELGGLEIMLAKALAKRIFGDPEKVRFYPVTVQRRMAALGSEPGVLDWILKQYTILSTLLMSNWWYMGMADKLDDYLCPPGCEHKMDFVGLDFYWGIPNLYIERIQRLIDAAYRRFDRAPVCPEALYDILQDLHKKFPNYPLIIFENGSVKVADGWGRAEYIREHVKQVQKVVKDGTNVKGCICWSITSNREWDLEFNDGSDFGLYHIELESDPSLTRGRTPAADTYEHIIMNRRG